MLQKYLTQLEDEIMGHKNEFKLEHRLFNFNSLLVFISFLTSIIAAKHFIPPIKGFSITILIGGATVGVIYYISRFKKWFKTALVISYLCAFGYLSAAWYPTGGMSGIVPSQITFILMAYLIFSPTNLHVYFILGAISLYIGLFSYEYHFHYNLHLSNPVSNEWFTFRGQLIPMVATAGIVSLFRRMLEKHEKEIKQSREKYKNLVESIKNEYFLASYTVDGQVEYVSPSIYKILKGHPDPIHFLEETIHLKDNTTDTFSTRLPNGKIITLKFNENQLTDENDNIYIDAIVQDITQQVEHENYLKKAIEQQKELNTLQSNFVSMVSHQFRTPLTVINSNIYILKKLICKTPTVKIKELQEQSFERMETGVFNMTKMIEKVLIFSQNKIGRIDIKLEAISLKTLLSDVVKQLDFNSNTLIEIKETGIPQEVNADRELLYNAFDNLISNALKYSPNNEKPRIEINYREKEVSVHVIDNGIGISAKDQEHLFDPFFRSKNVENIKGTGIGLSIAKSFIEKHNGTLTVKSEINKGSEFIVILQTKTPL